MYSMHRCSNTIQTVPEHVRLRLHRATKPSQRSHCLQRVSDAGCQHHASSCWTPHARDCWKWREGSGLRSESIECLEHLDKPKRPNALKSEANVEQRVPYAVQGCRRQTLSLTVVTLTVRTLATPTPSYHLPVPLTWPCTIKTTLLLQVRPSYAQPCYAGLAYLAVSTHFVCVLR